MQEETQVVNGEDAAVQENAVPETSQAAPDLNIQDLVAMKSIIDVASTRGAFRAAEMEAVGKVFNKLSTFLDSVTAKEQSKE
jgi:hypothetical protein